MDEFKSIIVGLELQPGGKAVTMGSEKAAQQAIWVAKANRAALVFLHSTFEDEGYEFVEGGRRLGRTELTDDARKALDGVVERARAEGLDASLEVTHDRVWIDITRRALRGNTDLVVVGKRNEPAGDGRKLGSVAIKLMRKCPSAVWVVKPEHDLAHRLVLAATDLTEVGDRATRYAADVATRQGCELHVVHAYQIPFELQMEGSRMSEEDYSAAVEDVRQRACEHIRRAIGERYRGEKELELHTGKGTPSTVIREAVAHLDPDLLVMGTVSRTAIAGLLVGSTAERLLDRVDCSILTVKPEGFVSPIALD